MRSGDAHDFVILERSKERSDAAQTLGSTVQILLRCTRQHGRGMDPRVSATPRRGCSARG
ncbi:hypothetical protein FJ543_17620 [Mesorhizobium sp. B2-5-7]|nr:hypothetical protein FJ543_17620 [Mesorhizobium sp. B2-5-7]TPM04260.1 hypothetical protein FJ943_02475 [Mesorhizobium sp. B2-3-10]